MEAIQNGSASADVSTSEEVRNVVSCASTQHVSATSSIVPVLVSSVQEPQKKVLTYALLNTQSDSPFISDDLPEAHQHWPSLKL